jgi:hypothetical protein
MPQYWLVPQFLARSFLTLLGVAEDIPASDIAGVTCHGKRW